MTAVTINLPESTLERLKEFADTERRSRSNAATVLLDEALERIIAESTGREGAANAAAKAHLAEHRRLSGLNPHEETK